MQRVLTGVLAAVLAVAAPAAMAQSKPPLKLGGILDMSGLYADITGMRRVPSASRPSIGALSHILMRRRTFRSTTRRATDFISSECGIVSKYLDKSASTTSA